MKFGIIDEVFMNTIVDAVAHFEDIEPAINRLISDADPNIGSSFFATIKKKNDFLTANITRFSGVTPETYAWSYEWDRVTLGIGTDTFNANKDGVSNTEAFRESYEHISSGFVGYAFNINELSSKNTVENNIVYGINMSNESYPAGFSPIPQPDETVVELKKYFVGREGGQIFPIFLFNSTGIHDGDCD